MRIVHVIDYFQPKLGYQETFLAKEHARAGHEVYVVTSDRYNPGVYFDAKDLLGPRRKGTGFFIEEGIRVWRLKTLFELPNIIWIVGLESKVQELKPDIVVMHSITNFSAVRLASLKEKNKDFKLIFDDHATTDNATGKMRMLYPLFKWTFSRWIQKSADALVAILPETRAFMQQKYGIPGERISVIPLGADTELFRYDAAARREMRQELGIKDEEVLFINTGKIIPFRRLPVLIDAAARVVKKHPDIKVLIVGNGAESYIDELKQNVRSKGLEDRFIWLEAVPNNRLYRIYSAADVAVWPYGASIGMREAIACNLPIILGQDSKVTELVEGNNGLTYREGDDSDLARQVEKLLEPGLRKDMGTKGRKLVEARFSWKVIAEQFIEIAAGSQK